MSEDTQIRWRDHGVKVIPSGQLDLNTPQTPGMTRAAAITHARTGATKLWAGTVKIEANAKTGPHHHGELESVIYIVSGKARMRWGDQLEFCSEAAPGGFYICPSLCPAPGDQRLPKRAAHLRARAPRPGAGGGQSRHYACRETG